MDISPKPNVPATMLFPFSDPAAPGTPRQGTYGQHNIEEINDIVREAVKTAVEPYIVEIRNMKMEMTELQNKQQEQSEVVKYEMDKLKEDLVKLECYSRKDNLKFFGIRESAYENRFDCKRAILGLLQHSNINLHPKALESVHRLGPKQENNPRPIIVKFFHATEKELVFSKRQHIWNQTGIRLEEDFAPKVEANRKVLKPILIAASKSVDKAGKYEYSASLRLDKLNVNGKVYTVNNLEKLPQKLAPNTLATQTKGNITAFFTASSTLSNHHLAEQRIGNKLYNCNEQFYMEQKALTFKDHDTAKAIMKEKSPGLQKKLGRDKHIANFSESVWNNRCLDIMATGIRAKFSQNHKLRQSLLDTGNNMLLEANPKDSYWGVGLSIRDRRIWEHNSWIGQASNHLGRLLHELRREIKNELKNTNS